MVTKMGYPVGIIKVKVILCHIILCCKFGCPFADVHLLKKVHLREKNAWKWYAREACKDRDK